MRRREGGPRGGRGPPAGRRGREIKGPLVGVLVFGCTARAEGRAPVGRRGGSKVEAAGARGMPMGVRGGRVGLARALGVPMDWRVGKFGAVRARGVPMGRRGSRLGVMCARGMPMGRRGRELGVMTVVAPLAIVGRHINPRVRALRAIPPPNGRHRAAMPPKYLILHRLSPPALLMIRPPGGRPRDRRCLGVRRRRRCVGASEDRLPAAPPRRGRGNPLQSASGCRGVGASRRGLSCLGRVASRCGRGCDGDAKRSGPGDVLCLLPYRPALCLSAQPPCLICRTPIGGGPPSRLPGRASALAARDSCHGADARACRCARRLLERKSLK